MSIRAVIFDLDGTLLDTIEDIANAANEALATLGFPPHDVAAYKRLVGEGMESLVRRALPEDRRDDPGLLGGAVEAMREVYGRRWDEKTRPYPGVEPLLDGLTDRKLPFAILSNKPDGFVKMCVGKCLPGRGFAAVRGVVEGVPRKPDPSGALAIARALGLDPARVLFLGDTSTDMRTAVAAGMIPAGALWGFRDRAELETHGARHLLGHPLDLLELL